LQNGDSIEIGKYKIKFVGDGEAESFDKTMIVKARPAVASASSPPPRAVTSPLSGGDSSGIVERSMHRSVCQALHLVGVSAACQIVMLSVSRVLR